MMEKRERGKRTASYLAKEGVVKISLMALGAAFEIAAILSSEVGKEIDQWEEGFSFCLGVYPKGPYMTAKKEGKNITFLGLEKVDPDVAILFKSLDSALLVFTGRIGTHIAGAEKRFFLHGNVEKAMKLNRALSMVQAFLFPKIIF